MRRNQACHPSAKAHAKDRYFAITLALQFVNKGPTILYGLSHGLKGSPKIRTQHEIGTLTLIVGPSGVGKSTFGRLASGIDVPDAGAVTLDGENIAQFEPHDVRTKITYVPQEPYLFSGTLRENLTLGFEAAIDEMIQRALRISAADLLVQQLPLGLDTHVGERGSALSGGQRQRVAIARALVKRPKIIILDEPTSALDAAAQRLMAAELQALKSEATLIIITHSPDIFAQPDQIVNFEALK